MLEVGVAKPGELDFAISLAEGAQETPPWRSFLQLLRDYSGADFATLHFRPPGRPYDEMISLLSPPEFAEGMGEVYHQHFAPLPPPFNEIMPEGVIYSFEKIFTDLDADVIERSLTYLEDNRIKDFLQMRITEKGGIHAWVGITSLQRKFRQSESQILEQLAPLLRSTLHNFVVLEHERYKAETNASAALQMQFGWLTLSSSRVVLDRDQACDAILRESGNISIDRFGKLHISNNALNRRFQEAFTAVEKASGHLTQSLSISRDPWLDMMLMPAKKASIATIQKPAVIVYLHGDSWMADGSADKLCDLFSLTKREAELALSFCRGLTIQEAATEFGLTLESTRNYSKKIYAKVGARGMPDLIRLIMRSVLAFYPR